uniref:Ion_trans domain-containing protein n=1 Tax=Panagrellus redivivus TaxID=6233 RepID=A0A7E5A1C8_PANRE
FGTTSAHDKDVKTVENPSPQTTDGFQRYWKTFRMIMKLILEVETDKLFAETTKRKQRKVESAMKKNLRGSRFDTLCQNDHWWAVARRLTSLPVCRLLQRVTQKGQFESLSRGLTRLSLRLVWRRELKLSSPGISALCRALSVARAGPGYKDAWKTGAVIAIASANCIV